MGDYKYYLYLRYNHSNNDNAASQWISILNKGEQPVISLAANEAGEARGKNGNAWIYSGSERQCVRNYTGITYT